MQTRSLQTLVSIARLGSFAATAEALNMTLSAVSMQMKALEAELDAPLFDRAHRPPQLTPLGRAVCAQAQQMLQQEAALQALCRDTGALVGRFRIGFVATASIRLLPGFLTRAGAEAPQARFDIETGVSEALQARVRAGLLDAAVVTEDQSPPPGLRYDRLRQEPMVVAHPKAMPGDLAGLFARLPFLHFQANSGIGKLIADHVAPYRDEGSRVIYLDAVEAIMGCVNEGVGFTLLPEPDVQRSIGPDTRMTPQAAPGLTRALALATATTTPADQTAQLAALFDPANPGARRNF